MYFAACIKICHQIGCSPPVIVNHLIEYNQFAMSTNPIERVVVVALIVLFPAVWGVGCGDDPSPESDDTFQNTSHGIAAAWVGNGDYLIAYNREENGANTTEILPGEESEVPDLDRQEGTCATSAGFELYPYPELGPIFGSSDFTSRANISEESFRLELNGVTSSVANPDGTVFNEYGTGDNSYVVEIVNGDDEPLNIETSWSVDTEVDVPGDNGEARAVADVSPRIFVGETGDCREVTEEYEIFDIESADPTESIEERESETVEVEGDRVKLVLDVSGAVVAQSQGSGSEEAAEEPFEALLDAEFQLEIQ